ncbi:hypothetical protein HPP92_000163 [Vanilla planifolia]|uniref:C3H1-type domain-containing protein n=1 Tax=Vanilla planifolia TaxID=51239 RepID=A0A835RXH3_VANPL|nr:hypothetical protein HPP92_000163 [Vanilla planifolia]
MDSPELVWVSKSQAEQRKGRTGRTCDGLIYRLVTGSFYKDLRDHEDPAILRLSLRNEVLMICCAESKVINDPRGMLQKTLDPPESETVEDALSLLVRIHALKKTSSHRGGRYDPTFYGRLLDSLPLSFDASVLVLKFGQIGFLREGFKPWLVINFKSLLVVESFCSKYLDGFLGSECCNILQNGKKEILFMANLCAYQFWQRVLKDKLCLERLKQVVKVDDKKSPPLVPKLEEEWCLLHNLARGPLHNVSDIYDETINCLHRFRPGFFTNNELPTYYEPYEFRHTCLLPSQVSEVDEDHAVNSQAGVYADKVQDSVDVNRRCVATPFVASGNFQSLTVAETFISLIKMYLSGIPLFCDTRLLVFVCLTCTFLPLSESLIFFLLLKIKMLYLDDTNEIQNEDVNSAVSNFTETTMCKFFLNGGCRRGEECYFSHSLQAKRPLCKFFLSFQGCRNGDSCVFCMIMAPECCRLLNQILVFKKMIPILVIHFFSCFLQITIIFCLC